MRKITSFIFAGVFLLSTVGCNKKNNPLLSLPGSGVTGVSLFIPQIDTTGTEENRIFVLVRDQGSTPIRGFQLGNFSILEDGKPGVPISVGNVTDPLFLALSIDRSGSMAGSRTTAANSAAVSLINALGANDFAALVEFESDVVVKVGFTTDKSALTTAINAGVASGGTSLYDSIEIAAGLLQGQPGRRLLIVLTDGDDTASSSTAEKAIKTVNDKGISAYTVGLGVGFNAAVLQQIATDTGGTFASSTDGSGLSAIFLTILDGFNNLNFIRYRRRSEGSITVFLNFGALTAQATKKFD